MSKRRLSLKVRIPEYHNPRNKWREELNAIVKDEVELRKIGYPISVPLELKVVLYLKYKGLEVHDVDNRLKDIMDALQGRAGGPKGKPTLKPIIKNDNQIYKVTIEKLKPPKQSLGQGHLVIMKYK